MTLMLRGSYLHPNGQMPAYEWNFSDVNPPVHAFATLFLHRTEQALRGEVDLEFLTATFNKLLLNFTWWVNRKDRFGKNVFEGGFLGLDNIGVFDRSAPLPTGGHLEQADGTAWMALFSQNMLELAVELAAHDPTYEDMVFKFVEHFYFIAAGMNRSGRGRHVGRGGRLLLRPAAAPRRPRPRASRSARWSGSSRSAATTVIEKWQRERVPRVTAAIQERLRRMPELAATMHATGPGHLGRGRAGTAGAGQPGPAPADPVEDARRERVPGAARHPRALEVPRAAPVHLPRARAGTPRRLPAGRIEQRHVRRQLQLARARLDAGQRDPDQGAAELLHATTATASRWNARRAPAG